jgi:hypothetical protein
VDLRGVLARECIEMHMNASECVRVRPPSDA